MPDTAPIDVYRAVLAPIEQARGLPNVCYTSRDHYALEQDCLFKNEWACLGFAHDVPDAGDVLPVTFAGEPLVMTRDGGGAVHVFHNVCRHRGMELVAGKRHKQRVLACGYHCWTYALTGELLATPRANGPRDDDIPGMDKSKTGLIKVRSAIWMGMVFVNLSGTAGAFEDFIGPLAGRWREFMPAALYHGGDASSFSLDLDCNWKLAVENYCESYHLPSVHPSLNQYSKIEDHYHIEEAGRFSGQGTTVYSPGPGGGRALPDCPGLSGKWRTGAEYVALYPNVLLGVHRDHFYAILLTPGGPEKTNERVEIFYFEPDAGGDEGAALRQENAALWRGVFLEDVFAVEGMQKGRHASGFDGGVFAPAMDGPTHAFHRWAAERLADAALTGL